MPIAGCIANVGAGAVSNVDASVGLGAGVGAGAGEGDRNGNGNSTVAGVEAVAGAGVRVGGGIALGDQACTIPSTGSLANSAVVARSAPQTLGGPHHGSRRPRTLPSSSSLPSETKAV